MAKITVITHAFNPGEYIYPCVDSVLNQSFRDFKYVIVDNASSDGTKEVLEEYAKKDSRICLYRNEDNSAFLLDSMRRYVDTDYFMILDHDDYLEKDALEQLFEAAEKGNLDIVFGRCEMVGPKGNAITTAGVEKDISCMTKEGLCAWFAPLYWQMRTIWGKLIRKEMIQYIDEKTYEFRRPSKYGGDTVIVLSMAFAAERLGTVGKVLHHYRILDKSQSRTYCRQRFLADWVLLDMARNLLREHDGFTLQNEEFLFKVYYNAISDTLRILMNSNSSSAEKCEVLDEILVKEQTIEMYRMLQRHASEEEKVFVKQYSQAVLALYVEEKASKASERVIFDWLWLLLGENALCQAEFDKMCISHKAPMLQLCLGEKAQVYKETFGTEFVNDCPQLFLALAMSEEKNVKTMAEILYAVGENRPELYTYARNAIEILASQNALLRNIDKSVWDEVPNIVAAVCAEEYVDAINLCFACLEEERWQKSGNIVELTTSLAAILGEAEAFIALKKMSCMYLLQEEKIGAAETVLRDLEEMCPGDAEVLELKAALGGKA